MSAVLKEHGSKAKRPMLPASHLGLAESHTKKKRKAGCTVPKKASRVMPSASPKSGRYAIILLHESAEIGMHNDPPKSEHSAIMDQRESAMLRVLNARPETPDRANMPLPETALCWVPDLAPIIASLRELHRKRQDFHRAEKSLTLQIKAICRRFCAGDKADAGVLYDALIGDGSHPKALHAEVNIAPFLSSRAQFEASRKEVEKMMEREAKKLPAFAWIQGISGFGVGSLAAVIGETGDLSNYSTHSKLWKRLGLAVIDGERQRRVSGADAIKHGYCPTRRSIVWNIGQCVFKAQSQRVDKETGEVKREAGPYRKVYDARKELELTRTETKAHAHNRATRYMEKKLMRDLWRAWRSQ